MPPFGLSSSLSQTIERLHSVPLPLSLPCRSRSRFCDGGPLRVKALMSPSRNAKNTSTAYPTRKAMASGDAEACWVKLPNSQITVPPMAAIRKRAELAADGVKVRLPI